MINAPVSITKPCFQTAWLEVVNRLRDNQWTLRNLIVHIKSPTTFCHDFHQNMSQFAEQIGLLGPKHVAYTIFPHKLYERTDNADLLYKSYNRHNGLFDRIQKRKRRWGSYFRRMTRYETKDGIVNQIDKIIRAINDRDNVSRAAYTILIQKPGGETVRPLGGPCLNYMAVQLERNDSVQLGLLAVYRNHDFLERAYGNYWGLCNLVSFLAKETGVAVGPLTCVSSHAYVSGKKTELRSFMDSL